MCRSANFIFLFFLLISLFNFSCKKEVSSSQNDSVTFALTSTPGTLDPRFATDANSTRLGELIFNSLVRLGPELKIIADAAETWSYENQTYTFTLRPKLKFSNGREIDEQDILYSFQEFQAESCPYHSSLAAIQQVKVEKSLGLLKVHLLLKRFSASLLEDLGQVKILPKDLAQNRQGFAQNPIGSGSFLLESLKAGEVVLAAVENHSWAPAKIKKVVFKIIQDENTLYLKTLKGDIDLSQADMPLDKVADLEKQNHLQVFKHPGLSMSYLLFNLRNPILQNKNLRRALAMAIDRKTIIQYKLHGLATLADSLLSPVNPYSQPNLNIPEYNLSAAMALLQKEKINDLKLTLKTSNSQEAVEIGKVLVQQLKEIGVTLELQSYEWGTFYQDVQKGNFQLATMRWVGVSDPDLYRTAFHSNQFPPGRNRGYYSNPRLDQWLDEGLLIENMAKRIEHYKKIQQTVADDLPIFPLWYLTQVAVAHKRLKNYHPDLNGSFSPLRAVEIDGKFGARNE